MVVTIVQLFNLDWRRSYIVSLYKVLAKLLSRRLSIFAEEETLTEAQGGFRSERRCADQILILKGVCELRRKEKKGTYIAFLDVSKAYDTVW